MVLNRYDPRKLEIEEGQIAKTLALPLKWKVPNDFAGVRQSIDSGVALATGRSPVAAILQPTTTPANVFLTDFAGTLIHS